MNASVWVLFKATETQMLLVGREMDIVGYSCSCLESEGSSMEPAESDKLLVLPIALFLLDSVPGLKLEVDMEMLLPLLLNVPTSLPPHLTPREAQG
jgi:hypothetical protein